MICLCINWSVFRSGSWIELGANTVSIVFLLLFFLFGFKNIKIAKK